MTQEKIDLLLRKPRLYKCVNSPVYMESWEASGAHCPDKAPPPNLAQTTNTFHDTQENAYTTQNTKKTPFAQENTARQTTLR